MNEQFNISKISLEQRQTLVSCVNDIIMSMDTRSVNIEKLIHVLICESIFLKKYDVLQKLANNKLI